VETLALLRLAPLSERASGIFEAALTPHCVSLSRFRRDDRSGVWEIEALPRPGAESALDLALALAAAVSGEKPERSSLQVPQSGWLARNRRAFPPLEVGRRFLICPTHHPAPRRKGRMVIRLDAGLAFGSGEHASTRGVLRALEDLKRRPRRIVDLGTGSGILALAAIRLWRRKVIATDQDPVAVRVALANARLNRLAPWLEGVVSTGWQARRLKGVRACDVVMANILARPLIAMARPLALHLAPGGRAILSGLLARQERAVLSAHRRQGLVLVRRIEENGWRTLVVRRGWGGPAPLPR
jgi:ribosomal protein L11 methyltransferase